MDIFVTNHIYTLQSLYNQLFSEEHQQRITFENWVCFSFYQTTIVRPNDISC